MTVEGSPIDMWLIYTSESYDPEKCKNSITRGWRCPVKKVTYQREMFPVMYPVSLPVDSYGKSLLHAFETLSIEIPRVVHRSFTSYISMYKKYDEN